MTTQPHSSRTSVPSRAPQQGIVLVIALIMMGVIAAGSAIAIKLAMSSGQIAASLRGNSLAMQAAEAGLRWCELQARLAVRGNVSAVVIQEETGEGLELWRNRNNFSDDALVASVPQNILATNGLISYPRTPECLVQRFSLPPPLMAETAGAPSIKDQNELLLLTVRGFSPDYRRGANSTGGEVWLQSILSIPLF